MHRIGVVREATFAEPGVELPRDFAGACVLMLLHDRGAYSADDLRGRLEEFGLGEDDVGPAEEILEALQYAGLVQETGSSPGVPSYRLTALGGEQLQLALDDLRGTQLLIGRFLARCEERCLRVLPPAS